MSCIGDKLIQTGAELSSTQTEMLKLLRSKVRTSVTAGVSPSLVVRGAIEKDDGWMHITYVPAPAGSANVLLVNNLGSPVPQQILAIKPEGPAWSRCLNLTDEERLAHPETCALLTREKDHLFKQPPGFTAEAFMKRFKQVLAYRLRSPLELPVGSFCTIFDLAVVIQLLLSQRDGGASDWDRLSVMYGILMYPWNSITLAADETAYYLAPHAEVIESWMRLGSSFIHYVNIGLGPSLPIRRGVLSQHYTDWLKDGPIEPFGPVDLRKRALYSTLARQTSQERAAAARVAEAQRQASVPRATAQNLEEFSKRKKLVRQQQMAMRFYRRKFLFDTAKPAEELLAMARTVLATRAAGKVNPHLETYFERRNLNPVSLCLPGMKKLIEEADSVAWVKPNEPAVIAEGVGDNVVDRNEEMLADRFGKNFGPLRQLVLTALMATEGYPLEQRLAILDHRKSWFEQPTKDLTPASLGRRIATMAEPWNQLNIVMACQRYVQDLGIARFQTPANKMAVCLANAVDKEEAARFLLDLPLQTAELIPLRISFDEFVAKSKVPAPKIGYAAQPKSTAGRSGASCQQTHRPSSFAHKGGLVEELSAKMRQLPQPPSGYEQPATQTVPRIDTAVDKAVALLVAGDVVGVSKESATRDLTNLQHAPPMAVPAAPTTVEVGIPVATLHELGREERAELAEPYLTDTSSVVDVQTARVSKPAKADDANFYVTTLSLQASLASFDTVQTTPAVFAAKTTIANSARPNVDLLWTMANATESKVPKFVGDFYKAFDVGTAELQSYRKKVTAEVLRNRPTAGSILGQLARYVGCMDVHYKTKDVPEALLRRAVAHLNLRTALDLSKPYPNPDTMLSNPFAPTNFNKDAGTGLLNGGAKRTAPVHLADLTHAQEMWHVLEDIDNGVPGARDLWARTHARNARLFEFKPKLEMNDISKFYTKSRTIFVANSYPMLPANAVYQSSGSSMKAMTSKGVIYGQDTQLFFQDLLRRWSLNPPTDVQWLVMSDNLYAYSNGQWYSFDGVKMEACIKPSTGRVVWEEMRDAQAKASRELTIFFREPPDPGRWSDYMEEFPASHLAPQMMDQLVFNTDGDIDFRQRIAGMDIETVDELETEVDDELGDLYPVVIHLPPFKLAPGWNAYFELVGVPSLSEGLGVLGSRSLPLRFMPSGLPFTTILNFVTSTAALLEIQDNNIAPDQLTTTYQPSFMEFKLESRIDLTPVLRNEGTEGEVLRADFLGWDLCRRHKSWWVCLRESSLLPGPYYHSNYAQPHSEAAKVNHVSTLMANMINGAAIDPVSLAIIAMQLDKVKGFNYSESAIKQQVNPETADVALQELVELPAGAGFWPLFTQKMLSRCLIHQTPRAGNYVRAAVQFMSNIDAMSPASVPESPLTLVFKEAASRPMSELLDFLAEGLSSDDHVIYWSDEPIAPEDLRAALRSALDSSPPRTAKKLSSAIQAFSGAAERQGGPGVDLILEALAV